MNIDHVVLWIDNPKRALEFYCHVVGLAPVRAEECEAGKASFPSLRINRTTILGLMARDAVDKVREFTGGAAMSGVALTSGGKQAFGAQGGVARSDYFNDTDGNVVEIRYYGGAD